MIKVWSIDYSTSYLVRGTTDEQEARDAVLRYQMDQWRKYEERFDEEEAFLFRAQLEALKPDIGWFRTDPCHCGEGHRFDMASSGPGVRGSFKGVYLA